MSSTSIAALPSGELQRETLSKTVGGTGRLWIALTERDFVFWGEVEHAENWPRTWCFSVGGT